MLRSMLLSVFVVVFLNCTLAEDLRQATLISVNAKNQPLRDVLKKFEQQAEVTFRVESILPRTEELLAKNVTIRCESKPFWEALSLLTKAANLRMADFYRSTIVLKPKSTFPVTMGARPVAKPITQGPFQAGLEKHEIFEQLDVVIRPEPWVGQPYVVSYEATIHFEDGQSVTYQPDYLIWVYELSDEVSLRIEMDDWPKGAAVHRIDVTARLQVGQEWKRITLPPISKIATREIKAKDGVISIERAGFEKKTNPKYDEYGVKLRLEGVDIADDAKGLDRFFLVSPDGDLVKSKKAGVSRGETNNIKWTSIDLGFTPEEVKGDFEKYRLSLLLVDGTEKVIGPFAEIAPKIVDAGKSQIAISRSRLFAGQFEVLNYGIRIHWDKIRLDVGQDALREPYGHSRSSGYPHDMSVDFRTHDVRTRRSQWKLVVEAPTKIVDKTLTFTFRDIEIPEE